MARTARNCASASTIPGAPSGHKDLARPRRQQPLYLLDTQLDERTAMATAASLHQLYGGDRRTRIEQEIMLGVGGVRALPRSGCAHRLAHQRRPRRLPGAGAHPQT
jgi:hypothetical protein